MAFSSGEVDQAATCQQEDAAAVGHEEFLVVLSNGSNRGGLCFQVGDFDLTVVMTSVAHNGPVFHGLKVASNDDVFHARSGAENVTNLGGFVHGHHAVAFHDGP